MGLSSVNPFEALFSKSLNDYWNLPEKYIAMIMEFMELLDPESLDNNRHRHHHHPKDEKGKGKKW
jgi:hypothetical protein